MVVPAPTTESLQRDLADVERDVAALPTARPAPTPPPATVDVHALHRTLEALEPYGRLAAAGGLRALPVEGRDGQTGGSDPQAAADRMMDRGELGRGRRVWSRLRHVAGPARATLLWLADRGGARPDPGTAALLYAREAGPIELRQALDRAVAAREKAAAGYAGAGPRRGRALTQAGAKARDGLTQSVRAEAAAEAALRAWGTVQLAGAIAAWDATSERRAA